MAKGNWMSFELREEMKKKILVLAGQTPFPLHISDVEEKLGITYPCAQGMLFELVLEGYLIYQKRGWSRLFLLNHEKFLPRRAVVLEEVKTKDV